MARTPALSNYRTTKVPKSKVPSTNVTNNIQDENNVEGAVNSNPLSAYANTPSTPINSSSPQTTINMGNNMSADITDAAKEPVNSDLNYYQQLANLTSKNDLLVEKYGLQSYRDEAISQMAQQDAMRQQSQKALQEQMRATGLNNGALSETMQGNLLMNYNKNVKDINADYNSRVSSGVKEVQDENFALLTQDLEATLMADENGQMNYDSAMELYNKIMDADISSAQKRQLIKNYNLDPAQYLADGVTINDDGTLTYKGVVFPANFGNILRTTKDADAILKMYKWRDETKEKIKTKANELLDRYKTQAKEKYNEYVSTDWGKNEKEVANALSGKLVSKSATAGSPEEHYVEILGSKYNAKEIAKVSVPSDLTKINYTDFYYSGDNLYVKDKTAVGGWRLIQGFTAKDLFNKIKK